ncbi:hypothetical protein KIN20_001389, partial [Parelaphostrongylus tenuis]
RSTLQNTSLPHISSCSSHLPQVSRVLQRKFSGRSRDRSALKAQERKPAHGPQDIFGVS